MTPDERRRADAAHIESILKGIAEGRYRILRAYESELRALAASLREDTTASESTGRDLSALLNEALLPPDCDAELERLHARAYERVAQFYVALERVSEAAGKRPFTKDEQHVVDTGLPGIVEELKEFKAALVEWRARHKPPAAS